MDGATSRRSLLHRIEIPRAAPSPGPQVASLPPEAAFSHGSRLRPASKKFLVVRTHRHSVGHLAGLWRH
eukprot:COSAG02_NODE_4940_length_4809_cov_26.880042_3_plen_69_part_00